jgi:hypothetical protein
MGEIIGPVLVGELVPAVGVKYTCAVLSAVGVGALLGYLGTLMITKSGKVDPLLEASN